MDFVAAALLLILYFIRPQDWVPGLAGLNIVKPIIALGLIGLMARSRPDESDSPSSSTRLGLSPHDIGMMAYVIYIVATAPDNIEALKGIIPLGSFYLLTSLALTNSDRLRRYLTYWTVSVFAVSALAVASKFGVDITQSSDLTEKMQGRLVLNTWMLNNPNALGHTAITTIPLAYFIFFWRSSSGSRMLAVLFALTALYCVYLTESKGAFLAGFATLVASLLFGRQRWIQIIALLVAATTWSSLLATLPRMEQMQNLRSDEGVMGRLMAWELARTASKNHSTGEGWKKFEAYINWDGEAIRKATHSCYVRVGADLGYPGLFVYIALLFFGVRSLVHYRGPTEELERCRRALFALIVAYLISGWMIDRSYHTEFFLMLGAIRCYHRLAITGHLRKAEDEEASSIQIAPQTATIGFSTQVQQGVGHSSASAASLPAPSRLWNHIGVIDLACGIAVTWGVLYTWDYIMKNL